MFYSKFYFFFFYFAAAPSRSVSPGECVSDCRGIPDGDYQSCKACDVYVSCVGGTIFSNRPCVIGTVWDDNLKRCEFKSSTCWNIGTIEPITEQEDDCIVSCSGLADGDYQSCLGCTVYASCVGGYIYDNRPCPGGLLWDDNLKQCAWESTTCFDTPKKSIQSIQESEKPDNTEKEPSEECVSSCKDKPDGDFQSCEGCDVYLSCVNGNIIDKRLCPPSTYWDDNAKSCLYESSTCHES